MLRSTAAAFAAALALVAGAASADVVIPSTVYRRGANSAEFRSDVRVFNPTTSPVNYTPVLYDQVSGQTITGPLKTIPGRTQQAFDNIVGTIFGKTLDDGAFGPIRFQTTGTLIVSSSVNNYNACGNGAVSGQWLPGLDGSQALTAGTLVQLASSANLSSGYRTNVVFTNPGGSPATVNATVHRGDGSTVNAVIGPLGPNGFTQIGNWGAFPGIDGTADTNVWLSFTSDQPVLSFASVINNQSGDPFAIVMTNEPPTGAGAPLANYSVSANPTAGQPVTFTDTSTGGAVVNRFWVFGDGTTQVGGTPAVKTYAAAGTYKTWLYVDNASGANSTTKDVVVATGSLQPIAVTISATTTNNTKWTFVCQSPSTVCNGAGNNNATLKVGQPYTITWTTPAAEAKTHGVGGLGILGIGTQCDVITSSSPCTVNLTPTTQMLNSQQLVGGTVLYACTQTSCAPSQAVHNGMTGTITIVP